MNVLKTLKKGLKIMNNIILKDLLEVISEYDLVRIFMEREHKSEGFQYLTTASPIDILEDEEDYLLDSDLRVTGVSIMFDPERGQVLEIIVKEIGNESK